MLGESVAPVIEAQPVAFMPAEAEVFRLGPSIIAFGAEAIPAAREEVASISEGPVPPAWRSSALPLVIRGGEQGGTLAAPAPPAAVDEPEDEPL